jgi:hypothetical protein
MGPRRQALADMNGHNGTITDEDASWLLRTAGAYIVEDEGPGGRSVYRPFQALRIYAWAGCRR